LIAAIQRAHASGSTALYEALYIALKRLASDPERDQTPRRQAVVVLTDGDDTTSHVTFDAVYAQARGNDAAVYGIIPPSTISRDAYRYPQPESLFDLRLLADETGGRVFTPARTPDLIGVYAEIADEFRKQYWLAFAPPESTPGFRRIVVRVVSNPLLRPRTRSGYNAGAPRPAVSGQPR